jgi:hypothetical protein
MLRAKLARLGDPAHPLGCSTDPVAFP